MENFILEMLFDIYMDGKGKEYLKSDKFYLKTLKESENKLDFILKQETEEQKILIREYEEETNFLKILEIEEAYVNGFLDGVKLSKDIKELSEAISF
ncbi:hypothetical protein REJ83_018360 [Clostridioides difficile]|nr:hypothetical protein [Clostridioides difficile]